MRHRTVANLLLILLIAAGAFSIPNMRAQFFPDVIIDEIDVSVAWDGAGAEDVDRGIVQVLEPALLAVEGVEGSQAVSREGRHDAAGRCRRPGDPTRRVERPGDRSCHHRPGGRGPTGAPCR